MTQNQIAYWTLVEQKRANQAKEFENERSNRAKEKYENRDIAEKERSNLAREVETHRSNVVKEGQEDQKIALNTVQHTFDNMMRVVNLVPILGGILR